MILTIGVVTMNRSAQLREALESCLACKLPKDTEFVIIDNASTDDTEQTVKAVLEHCGYSYYYEKLPKNIGAGAGRNMYFAKAQGAFLYGMDDDAVIDVAHNPDFFLRAIEIMENNPKIGALATQIFDIAWDDNRQVIQGSEIAPGIYKSKMFSGGSHFLRTAVFSKPPYLPNKYGYEELPPSLHVMDMGMFNAFCPSLLAIHKPAVNKWNWSDEKNHNLLINECAIPYAIKKMMYPMVFRPLLHLAFVMRCRKHLKQVPDGNTRVKAAIQEMYNKYRIYEKVKVVTVLCMAKDFGLSVF